MDKNTLYNRSKYFLGIKVDDFTTSDVTELGKILKYHSELYYEKDDSIISDSEYDELLKKLEVWEKKFWIFSGDSQNVWSAFNQSTFSKVKHSRPMISLWNTYNAEDLQDFDVRIKRILKKEDTIPYCIEFKFDGLGIELIYNDWVLVRAITRGNWVEWEDVTQNIMQIQNIPKTIAKKWTFEVRGEVVMPISSFTRLNDEAKEKGEKVFSNPRNAASGSLRVLDTSITKKRDLQYFAYDVSDFSEFSQWKYSSMIYALQDLWFEISSYLPECKNIDEVIHHIETIWDIKNNIDFEIDGLVVKVNDISLWQNIGFTEHHPRYAIAYKFPAEIVTTIINSVEHSVGRTGSITPVANLEAINIWWAIIRRATLHNYDEVSKLWVRVGDSVFLKRAGEVIPKIISVASSLWDKDIFPPSICPSCWETVLKDDEKVRYYCPNSYACPAQMKEKLAFAVWKQGFNIDGFWERQAAVFYNLGILKTFADIFRLKDYQQEILALDGFKEKSVNNLLTWIEKVRKTDIVTFLKALGIPGVWKKTAKTLGKVINTVWHDIIIWKWNIEKLETLPDIWPEVAQSVIEFFENQQEMVQDLLWELDIIFIKEAQTTTDSKWSGMKVCITWSFDRYKRDQLAEILEQKWWEFMWSVSAKTDYLLAGEKAWSKLKKANELWVKVLSLEDFLES